jgi:hypothetical protein
MSRAHAEIAHQTRRLGQLIDDIGTSQPDQPGMAALRALLYGLHAIFRLHTTQEDESYLSLDTGARPGQPSHGQNPARNPQAVTEVPRAFRTGHPLGCRLER